MGKISMGHMEGNPFVGLFIRCTDKDTLLPKSSADKVHEWAKPLSGRITSLSVDGSSYLGLYIAMNSNGIIVPKILANEEMAIVKGLGLNVYVMKEEAFSACGNNVACNDNGALINPDMHPSAAAKIAETLGVEFEQRPLAGYKCSGMACVATNKGYLAHNRISEEEATMLEGLFKVKGMNGTVNGGTALVGAGVCATSTGAIVGITSSGFETARISQALDLI